MTRQMIKQNAKEALRFRYWMIVAIELIAGALLGGVSCFSGGVSGNSMDFKEAANDPETAKVFAGIVAAIVGIALVASVIGLLYTILFGNVIKVGLSGVRLKAYRKEHIRIAELFSGLKAYKKNVCTMALYTLFVTLGFMCFFVPGIIVGLGLYEVPYMLAEDPNISGMEAIRRSWENMKGHKGELFVLELSFIGWLLLTILTFGVLAIFWTGPYMALAEAGFYREMHPETVVEPAPEA